METKDWLLFLGPIIGLVIGVGVKWLEFSRDDKTERRIRTIKNLEELHLLMEEYLNICSDFLIDNVIFRSPTPIDSSVANEIDEMTKMMRQPLAKLRSIKRRYAPEFSEDFAEFENASANVYASASTVANGQITRGEFRKRLNLVQIKCNNFNHRIENKIADL